jgi:hypothetical protein
LRVRWYAAPRQSASISWAQFVHPSPGYSTACAASRWSFVAPVSALLGSPVLPSPDPGCPAAPSLPWGPGASVPHGLRRCLPAPPTRGTLRGSDCPLPLAGRFACRALPATLPASSVGGPRGSSGGGSPRTPPGLWVRRSPCSSGGADQETDGALPCPSSPLECLPRSEPPVGSQTLGLASSGLLPSGRGKPSACPLGFNKRFSSSDHNSTPCGARSRGRHSRSTRLRTSLHRNARGFATDLVPPFSQVGLIPISSGLTDWVTMTNFMDPSSGLHSQGLGFNWTRAARL